MAQKTYKTRQREEILAIFEHEPDRCFSARELITAGNLSAAQATVYRTLSMLTDEGVIRRFKSSVGGDCYKLACNHDDHIHFVCNRCGKMIHADCEFIAEMASHLLLSHGFTLDTGNTVIYGTCSNCSGS